MPFGNYTCAYCGSRTPGAAVWAGRTEIRHPIFGSGDREVKVFLCSSCGFPALLTPNGEIIPEALFGPWIEGLPAEVESAYSEARRCLSVAAYTGAELLCRKILMYVAVDKRAPEGKPFEFYLGHLSNEGYITPPMKKWTDLIRQHGNKATHKLESPGEDRAKSTLMFTAQLLRLVYEMDHEAERYSPAASAPTS